MAEFRIAVEVVTTQSAEDLSSAFYDEFDGMLVERAGRVTVSVYLEAATAMEAAHATITRLESAGLSVVAVDRDLVDGPEIASRLGCSRQAVQHWAQGTRGSAFPRPMGQVGGKRVWAWNQIVEWARQEGKTDETPGLSLDEAARVDAFLAERRLVASGRPYSSPWSVAPGTMKAQAGVTGDADYPSKQMWAPA